jgi:hypothetical protein
MSTLFRDEYGRAVDLPVNAICYELTSGGDLVRGKPHTWEALRSHAWQAVQRYPDLKHLTQAYVDEQVTAWLKYNEVKFDGAARDHAATVAIKAQS